MADGRIAVDQTIAWHLDLSTGVIEWMGYDEAGSGVRHGVVPVGELALDPQASSSLDRVMMQCASLGQPFQESIAYTMRDGRDVCFNVAGHLLVAADGTPGAIVGLAIASVGGSHFATAQVHPRAVTALHDFGRFGTLEFDAIGRKVRISDGLYRLLRLDPSVPVDIDTIRGLMHGDDSDGVQQAVEMAMRTRRPTTFDWRLATSPGQHRVMRTWMRFSYGPDDQLERIVGMVEDVTELVRERSARIAAEGKHRRIFESAPMGMAVVGTRGPDEGMVVEANEAFLAIVGGPQAEIIGSPLDRVSRRLGPFSALMAKLQGNAVVEIPVTSLGAGGTGPVRWVKGQVTTVDAGSELLLVQIDDVTAMVEAEARLQHLADIDDLTGLLNRRRFRELLDEALRDCAENGACASLLLLDVDRFKWVNDSRGHQAGDHLLRKVADVVRQALPDATVGRIAGDEFAVLLRGTDVDDASACAERLRREVHETLIDDGSGRPHHITVTVGVAALDGGGDIDRALIAADLAMYQGKQRGRNRVEVISNPDINQRMSTSVSWAERVRQALRDGAFELWQQPIINLRTRRVGKRELLLRMVGPEGERIAAGEFMTAAEDFGLAPEVDSWVLEHVAPLVHDHRRRESGVLLTINLSAQSIVDPSLVRRIDAALADRGVDPTEIMFEITETAAIADLDAAEALVRTLRDRDYGISIDDFGVGYGSFTYLERLPFECVKIDRSLSSKVTLHRDRRLPVQAMVLIARGLGRKTVAEGVEDAATAAMLKRLGVDYGQGYFFGRPAPWPPIAGDAPTS